MPEDLIPKRPLAFLRFVTKPFHFFAAGAITAVITGGILDLVLVALLRVLIDGLRSAESATQFFQVGVWFLRHALDYRGHCHLKPPIV